MMDGFSDLDRQVLEEFKESRPPEGGAGEVLRVEGG